MTSGGTGSGAGAKEGTGFARGGVRRTELAAGVVTGRDAARGGASGEIGAGLGGLGRVKVGDTLVAVALGGVLAIGASRARAEGSLAAGSADLNERKAIKMAKVTPADAMIPRLQIAMPVRARLEGGRSLAGASSTSSSRGAVDERAFARMNCPSRSRTSTLRSAAGIRNVGVAEAALQTTDGVVRSERHAS
jgi:hypothetical protein